MWRVGEAVGAVWACMHSCGIIIIKTIKHSGGGVWQLFLLKVGLFRILMILCLGI